MRTIRIFPVIMPIRQDFYLWISPKGPIPVNIFRCTRKSFATLPAASSSIRSMTIKDLGATFTFESVFAIVVGILGPELRLKFRRRVGIKREGVELLAQA